MAVMYDYVLDELRLKDVVLISLASGSVLPDPLIVNNLQVTATASINNLYLNNAYISTATIGNLTTNNISNYSTISTNYLYANAISASTASIGFGTFDRVITSTATIGTAHISNIEWNLTSGATLANEGEMNWVDDLGTVVVGMAGGNVDVALGMETVFPKRVKNSDATTMPKGTVVYINGVSGNDPTVTRAIATSDSTSAFTLGMTAEDITAGQKGWITTFGEITGLNLSSFTGGDTLYLSGATLGAFTNVAPLAPIHYVRVGTVVKATADGSLVVNVINGFELQELHNVVISSLASGQIIQSGASSLWYNRSLASAVNDFIVFPAFPSLGSLAVMNQLSFTSLTNQPSLSSLAFQSTIDYNSAQLLNKPSLGSLAEMNALSFTSLLNQPSLGSIAFQNTVDYSQLTNTPSLGSLAVMNQLSFTSLTNQPSLSSLAFQSTIDYTSAQLTNKPSLGSLAQISDVVSPLVLSGATLSLSQASIVHNNLGGLTTGDPHTQYVKSGGRVAGQVIFGGTGASEDLYLYSTSNATQGDVYIQNQGGQTLIGTGGFFDNENLLVYKSSGSVGAVNLYLRHDKTQAGGFNYGILNEVDVSVTTGTTDSVQGFFNYVNNSNLGTVNFVEAFTQRIDNQGTGTIDEASQIKIFTPTNNGTINTLYGIYLENQTGAGTNYSIYSDGGTMFHEGTIIQGNGYLSVNDNNLTPIATGATGDILAGNANTNFQYDASAGDLNLERSINNAVGINLAFYKSRGNTASPSIVTAGDDIGLIRAYAYQASSYAEVTRITLETLAGGATNSGTIRFYTANAGTIGERVVIREDGDVGIGIATPTAKLHVDQSSSTANIPVISLDQADSGEPFINYIGASSASSNLSIWGNTTVGTLNMKVRVSVNGIDRFMYLYTN